MKYRRSCAARARHRVRSIAKTWSRSPIKLPVGRDARPFREVVPWCHLATRQRASNSVEGSKSLHRCRSIAGVASLPRNYHSAAKSSERPHVSGVRERLTPWRTVVVPFSFRRTVFVPHFSVPFRKLVQVACNGAGIAINSAAQALLCWIAPSCDPVSGPRGRWFKSSRPD